MNDQRLALWGHDMGLAVCGDDRDLLYFFSFHNLIPSLIWRIQQGYHSVELKGGPCV